MTNFFFLRLVLGIIFINHAIPKLREPKGMASAIGWNQNQVFGLGIIEFISGVAVIGGVGVHLASLALSVVMLGAIYHKIKKWNVPFLSTKSTGWEFDLMVLASALTLYLN